MLLKIGILSASNLWMAFPTYSAPIRPDNPVPKIVKAKPVATWLVANTRAKKPKSSFLISLES